MKAVHTLPARTRRVSTALLVSAGIFGLSACSSQGTDSSTSAASTITITNCGEEVTYDKADKLFVNDSNLISDVLAVGGADKVVAVTKFNDDEEILREKFGADVVDSLPFAGENYPSLEEVISKSPDIYVTGWSYGLSEATNVTPSSLASHSIGTYILTESCRQGDSSARGTIDPWDAVREDITNLGKIVGDEATAQAFLENFNERTDTVMTLPVPDKAPVGFIFDSASDTVFTSGAKGGPAAVVSAAGSDLATADIDDTWVSVAWEKITQSQPDYFIFVDYPGQSVEEKVALLESNPATRDLDAVKNKRYIKLRYSMVTSGVLNIDAAEILRKALEGWALVPETDMQPELNYDWTVS
ncbi:MAG: ABC transporter substrate-binding protein [Corynebacterium sp.]|nr:ABC transporter substrate-binding protein [Corynebacterium sp.]